MTSALAMRHGRSSSSRPQAGAAGLAAIPANLRIRQRPYDRVRVQPRSVGDPFFLLMEKKCSKFNRLAQWCSSMAGRPAAFCVALGLIVFWLLSGPVFGFSDTWQLII